MPHDHKNHFETEALPNLIHSNSERRMKKIRILIGLAIALFAISLSVLIIWLMLLRGPALTQ